MLPLMLVYCRTRFSSRLFSVGFVHLASWSSSNGKLSSGQLRLNYPEINMTLLTATATPRVQKDILQHLNLTSDHKFFVQSFNRSNLVYECIPKGPTEVALSQIVQLIQTSYSKQSGIVYCFSRAECDRTGPFRLFWAIVVSKCLV